MNHFYKNAFRMTRLYSGVLCLLFSSVMIRRDVNKFKFTNLVKVTFGDLKKVLVSCNILFWKLIIEALSHRGCYVTKVKFLVNGL